jgi:hypothetical protein
MTPSTPKRRKQKGHAMSTKTMKNAVALAAGALGIVGAVAFATASPSWAAPIASNAAAVKTAASTQVTDVYYRRHGYYGRGYHRGRGYYGRGYYRRGYGYPYGGYAYPYGGYAYPHAYPSPYQGFSFGWQ